MRGVPGEGVDEHTDHVLFGGLQGCGRSDSPLGPARWTWKGRRKRASLVGFSGTLHWEGAAMMRNGRKNCAPVPAGQLQRTEELLEMALNVTED